MSVSHLGDVISALLDGELAPAAQAAAEAHLASCMACAAEYQATAFADWGCLEQGGINISPLDTGNLFVGAFWKDDTVDYCAQNGPAPPIQIETTRPTDGGWHFYRVTRSKADAKLLICIDGKKVASAQVPADKDLTSGLQTHLGRNQFSPAYFAGDLDDVRILSRALPCQ